MSKAMRVVSLGIVVAAALVIGSTVRASAPECLYQNESLGENEYLESGNGEYRFINHCTGSGCWLTVLDVQGQYSIWSNYSQANGYGADEVVMQNDGNLVQLNTDTSPATPVWATGTNGYPTARICMQSDSNLVIYYFSTPIWSIW